MTRFVLAAALLSFFAPDHTPEYSIEAIRYATSPNVAVSDLVVGGPKDVKVDIAMVVWLIRDHSPAGGPRPAARSGH